IFDDSTVTAKNSGNVSLSATDTSTITADAGGVAVGIAASTLGQGATVAASVGAATANNVLTSSVKAFIDSSTVTSAGGVSLGAESEATIAALAFGTAVSGAGSTGGGGLTGALAGAGAGASNLIITTVETYIRDADGGKKVKAGAGLALTASDDSDIVADAG